MEMKNRKMTCISFLTILVVLVCIFVCTTAMANSQSYASHEINGYPSIQATANSVSVPHFVKKKLGLLYKNNTGKDMYVSVVTHDGKAVGTTSFYYCSSTGEVNKMVSATTGGIGWYRTNFLVVPPNYYYKGLSGVDAEVISWIEWY